MQLFKRKPKPFTKFAAEVLDRTYTPAQLVWAKVAIDGVDPCKLDGAEREIAGEMFGPGVDVVPPEARRIQVAYFGRDSFKTGLAIDIALWRMMTADTRGVGPGEVPTVLVGAPDLAASRMLVRRATEEVRARPKLAAYLFTENADGFILKRADSRFVGFRAAATSRGGSTFRGVPILMLIGEEADFCYSGDGYVRTDGEMIRAAKPRLMGGPGGIVLLITTPWGEESEARKYYNANYGDPKTALVAVASTVLMRDHDPEVVARVDAEMVEDPDNGGREFYVSFNTIGTSRMFPSDVVDDCIDTNLVIPAVDRSFDEVVGGWDLAQMRDNACQTLIGRADNHHTVVSLRELRPTPGNPLRLSKIIETFSDDARPFGARRFAADGHAREPAREFSEPLGLRIVDVPAGQPGKIETHLLAKKLMSERRVSYPTGRLVAQLKAITATPTPGGGLRISSPRRAGSHGDQASSFVAGLWLSNQMGRRARHGHQPSGSVSTYWSPINESPAPPPAPRAYPSMSGSVSVGRSEFASLDVMGGSPPREDPEQVRRHAPIYDALQAQKNQQDARADVDRAATESLIINNPQFSPYGPGR